MRKMIEPINNVTKPSRKTVRNIIRVDAKEQNLFTIRKFIYDRMKKSGYSRKKISALTVSITEHCENLIRHAYAGKSGKIQLNLELKYPVAKITVLDSGPEFNMKEKKMPDTVMRVKRGLGGKMGIRTILALCDRVEYKRKDGYNENCFIVRERPASKIYLRKGRK